MKLLAAITLPIFALFGIVTTGTLVKNGSLPKPEKLQPKTKSLVTILLAAVGAGLFGWLLVLIIGLLNFFS